MSVYVCFICMIILVSKTLTCYIVNSTIKGVVLIVYEIWFQVQIACKK